MITVCKLCSGSGKYIDYVPLPINNISTTALTSSNSVGVVCKCTGCKGTGYVDDEDIVEVPRKYVKDEYWKNFK